MMASILKYNFTLQCATINYIANRKIAKILAESSEKLFDKIKFKIFNHIIKNDGCSCSYNEFYHEYELKTLHFILDSKL